MNQPYRAASVSSGAHVPTLSFAPLAVEVSIVRWYKDNQFGIEFLRYAQGDRERVTDLVEGCAVPVISDQAGEAELALSSVAAQTNPRGDPCY